MKIYLSNAPIIFAVFVLTLSKAVTQNQKTFQKDGYKTIISEQILTKLYHASGYKDLDKPNITFIHSVHTAASYNSITNSIKIEDKLYQICVNLGKDSLQALAYIIAHELGHAIQKSASRNKTFVSFIQSIDTNRSIQEFEIDADLQGGFICYLAGFKPARVLHRLIASIYKAYQLDQQKDSKYPSKSTRIQILDAIQAQSEDLIQLFETAFILLIQDEFELAEACYKHILIKYRGPEIYNNLGVSMAFQAMKHYQDEVDYYSFPFELDLNSKLYKTRTSRGDISIENSLLRNQLLQNALKQFEIAMDINPSYTPTLTNIISCYNLLNKPSLAIRFFDSLKLEKNLIHSRQTNLQKLMIAIGTSYALLGSDQCRTYFNECVKSNVESVRQFALHNLSLFNNMFRTEKITKSCPIEDHKVLKQDYFAQQKPANTSAIPIELEYNKLKFQYCNSHGNTEIEFNNSYGTILKIYRKKENSKDKLSLRKLTINAKYHANINYVVANNANYIQCRSDNILYKLNTNGIVKERIKIEKL